MSIDTRLTEEEMETERMQALRWDSAETRVGSCNFEQGVSLGLLRVPPEAPGEEEGVLHGESSVRSILILLRSPHQSSPGKSRMAPGGLGYPHNEHTEAACRVCEVCRELPSFSGVGEHQPLKLR